MTYNGANGGVKICSDCIHWVRSRKNVYGDGSEIVTYEAPKGLGHCVILNQDFDGDFGCAKWELGGGSAHIEITEKSGHPWSHFKMIKCPDCAGIGNGQRGHRCAGTGLVRLYDDGYVGDEQTRMHPKEKELGASPTCPDCKTQVERTWKACPNCGRALYIPPAEVEVIIDRSLPPANDEAKP